LKSIEISVIIPCYNDGIYLNDAIESLNAQTFRDFEIIIVDDASSDEETLKILSRLSQDNIKVIHLEKNSGLSTARNTGIKIAKGDYILPLDADDKILPTYLEKAKEILDMNKDTGIVYCEAEFFGLKTGKWPLPPYSFPEILVGNMIFATAMYRKTDWQNVGGYNKNMIHGNEDYDFWLSILELNREVYQIPEILFNYRIKEDSMLTRLASNYNNELNSYAQIFYNHKELYASNIRSVFAEIKRKQLIIDDKHQQILEKDHEIQERDRKIASFSIAIENNNIHIQNQGAQIDHLRQVVQSMRLINRAKRVIKKVIPQRVLNKIQHIRRPR